MNCKFYILSLLVALIYSVSLSSCIYDAPDAPLVSEEEGEELTDFKVALRFETEIPVGTTRAPGDGTYDDGTTVPYENFVDIENRNFRILFFSEANEYITTLDKITYVESLDGTADSKHYQVMGRLKDPLPENFKVVIVANWQNGYPDLTGTKATIADFCKMSQAVYTYTSDFALSAQSPIPMYGIKAFTAKNLIPFEVNDLGTIHLLRAMAKIEVHCAHYDWTIESVTLSHYNSHGYCAPANVVTETDYVTGSYATDYVDYVTIPTIEAQLKTNLALKPTANGSYLTYVPEYQNVVVDADGNKVVSPNLARLVVKIKELPDFTYYVDFKYYNDPPAGYAKNDPFDIKRNNYYNFTIRKSGDVPAIVVDVRPYDHIDLGPVFGQ